MPWRPLVCLSLVACASVREGGRVDEERVKLRQAVFAEVDDFYGDDGGVVVVVASDRDRDLCERIEDYDDDLDQSTSEEEAAEAWNDNHEIDFWQLTLAMRVDDPSDKLRGSVLFEGVRDRDAPEEEEFEGVLEHFMTERTPAMNADDFDDHVNEYYSDNGELDIRGHRPGKRLSAAFDSPMTDPDGTEEGELRVKFRAKYCDFLEDLLSPGGA